MSGTLTYLQDYLNDFLESETDQDFSDDEQKEEEEKKPEPKKDKHKYDPHVTKGTATVNAKALVEKRDKM